MSVSQAESILNVMPEVFLAESLDANGADVVEADQIDLVLACAGEDDWAVLTLVGDEDWDRLAGHLGGTAERSVLVEKVRAWAAGVMPREVMNALQGSGLAAGAMVRPQEYRGDPQLQARGFIVELDQPGLDAPLPVENAPCGSLRMLDPELVPAPFMFAHTRQVAHDLLGLNDTTIDHHITTGTLEVPAPAEA